jgi:F-type H+-transporting ATPase subunit epsilon
MTVDVESPDTLQVEVCSPQRPPVQLVATEVIAAGQYGIVGIQPGHTNLLASLGIGVASVYDTEGQERKFAVHGGFLEVRRNRVLILAQTAESAEAIDVGRADAARERAERRLRAAEDVDTLRAEMALARAMARIQASGGLEGP